MLMEGLVVVPAEEIPALGGLVELEVAGGSALSAPSGPVHGLPAGPVVLRGGPLSTSEVGVGPLTVGGPLSPVVGHGDTRGPNSAS